MQLDVDHIRQQLSNLLLAFPELAEDDVLRADMIEGATNAHRFLEACERKRVEAKWMTASIADYQEELDERKKRFERREQAMRQFMFKVMEAADLKKVELPEATLSIRPGVTKVIITTEELLPIEMWRFRKEPDKTKIKEAIQDGNPVPGAELSNAEPTLSIRTK